MKNMCKRIISLLLVFIMVSSMTAIAYGDNETENNKAQQLRKSISTLEDAIKYLDDRYPMLWQSYHLWTSDKQEKAFLRSAEEILNSNRDNLIGRGDIATIVAYLLSDNFDIGAIYGFGHGSSGSLDYVGTAIYIYQDNKYKIFDPVVGMKADLRSRFVEGILPNATVSKLSDYSNSILSDGKLKNLIDSLYAVKDGQKINFTDKLGWTTVTSPSVTTIYENKANNLTEAEYLEKQYGHIKPENINKYKISSVLGGLSMTVEEAKSLVGKSPEIIKEKVKTAGDLVLYMLSSRLLLKNGDVQTFIDGHEWHYNSPAYETLESNLGNCGRMANLANYLLEGDYQEVGFILHSYPEGGGHVYNYIKYKDKYYIVDFSDYLFKNYSVNNQFNIIALDKLEDYGTRWTECYGGLVAIIAHTSPSMHLPNVWEGNYCYYPEGAEFKVLMETPQMRIGTILMNLAGIDWTKPQTRPKSLNQVSSNADVIKAANLGLVPDNLNNNFENKITRAEFCALMVKAYEKLTGQQLTQRKAFLDTLDVNVQKMGALGVVKSEAFEPDKAITREQIAVMLSSLAETLKKPFNKSELKYKDSKDISSWAAEQAGQMQASELFVDIKDNILLPKGSYTREQSIRTILKFYEKMK